MSMHHLVRMVARAFSDQVTNFTVAPENLEIEGKSFNLKQGMAEIVFKIPAGAVLFTDGGDREIALPQGGKVLALYEAETDRWGWYLFWSAILGEFSINPG